ncbi:MAG: hypothetical protein M0P76_03200 [Candidatus Pacebacteria bacterium]|jgi:hypothetical protein|nr:hypothetical protein [Candidatus Paceibacterota bacterium]
MIRIKKGIETIGKHKAASFFFFVVLLSLCVHLAVRNDHFQECDSSLVYHVMRDFPYYAMTFTNSVTEKSPLPISLSKNTATNLVNDPIIHGLLKASFGGNFNEHKKETLINVLFLNTRSPLFYVRSSIIFGLIAVDTHLPYFIKAAFVLPLSSTYSFGHGFLYGLLMNPNISYEDFMSRALVLTLILFHLGVIFIFLTLRKLSVRPGAAVIGSLFALFSISLYSYGYHLGSTIWNFITSAFFLWFIVEYRAKFEDAVYLKKVSLLAGILVFFNYLIVVYWTAFILAYFLSVKREESKGKIFSILKTQGSALFLFFVCVILFFPPGQAMRGAVSSFADLFSFPYYSILNIFSFYNKSGVIEILQFIVFALLIFFGVYSFRKNKTNSERSLFESVTKLFFGILLAMMISRFLSLGPSRHILFVSPLLFILAGLGIDFIFNRHFSLPKAEFIVILLISVLGFFSLSLRILDVKDLTTEIRIDPNVRHIIVSDYSFQWRYKNWGEKISVEPSQPNFLKGETYLLLSNSSSTLPEKLLEKGFSTKVLNTQEKRSTGVQFTAYNPEKYVWGSESGFSAITFRVVDVPK